MKRNVSKVAACALTLAAASQAGITSRTYVVVGDRTQIIGNIVAGGDIDLGDAGGTGAKVTGNLRACGNVALKDGSSFGVLQLGGVVSPADWLTNTNNRIKFTSWQAIGDCSKPPLPSITGTSNYNHINVYDGQIVTLEPGTYGDVKVWNSPAKLILKPGNYTFASLTTLPGSIIDFGKNGTAGVNLKVIGSVNLGDRTMLTGAGAESSTFNVRGNFFCGNDATIPMAMVSSGVVSIQHRVNFKDITGNSVRIGNDCFSKELPPPERTIPLIFSDDFSRGTSGNYIGNDTSLNGPQKEKWKITKGSIDIVTYSSYGFFGATDTNNPDKNNYIVDLGGSIENDTTSTQMETLIEFEPGTYDVSFKWASPNRYVNKTISTNPVKYAAYEITIDFGSLTPTILSRNPALDGTRDTFQPFHKTATLLTKQKFKITATNPGNRAGMLLDDVVIRKLP